MYGNADFERLSTASGTTETILNGSKFHKKKRITLSMSVRLDMTEYNADFWQTNLTKPVFEVLPPRSFYL